MSLRAFIVYGEHGGRPGRTEGKNVGMRPIGRVLARDAPHAIEQARSMWPKANAFKAEPVMKGK